MDIMDDGNNLNEHDEEESFSYRAEVVHFLEEDGTEFIVGPGIFRTCEPSLALDDGSKLTVENDIKVISNEVESLICSTERLSSYNEDTWEELVSFNHLPREVILSIFSFFSVVELNLHVIPVCKRWYDIGHDPSLWKELDFSRLNEIPSTSLCSIISRASSLKKLNLMGRLDLTTAEVAVFSQYIPMLESLNIGFCSGVNKTVIEYFLRKCPRLAKLNTEGCMSVDDGAAASMIKGENLQEFNFSHCCITDESIVLLASRMNRIVSLNIDGISWISDRYTQCIKS